ncbi:MAG: molybdopterin-binding oxidoreductase, partial [Gemmatimonadetes bacterium]|nr:molybdopterin-binding oxidoreductase [Gemmatimonadota bacterium]
REVMIAGVAYAGGRAIERVEVSVDAGRTWKPAVLKPPVTAYRWRLWAYPWRPASKGEYTLVVRAVEAGGRVQDATRRDVLPDGATGYHRVRVKLG